MSEITDLKNGSRWTKVKRSLKKGAKKLIPVAVGWAAGVFFPPAGAALYSFLKDKIDKSSIPIPISDDKLQEICANTTSEKSVEFLQKALREALREVKGITVEQLETVLGTFLRPLNDSLNDAMNYIKQFPEQISYLMEEWKAENQELINQLHLDMDEGFDEIKTSLSVQTDKIDNILRALLRFEDKLDKSFASSVKTVFSADTISNLDLRITSKAQVSMANYSSRFDIDFDPDLFEPRKEANEAFFDFLRDLSSPFSLGKYLFLVLAGAGMGKTWTLAYWVYNLSEEALDFKGLGNFVPFFISIKAGLKMQLRGYFNAPDKHTARINLRKAKITSGLTPILFFDGLDEILPAEAKDILSFVLELSKEEIPVVLTCRNTDWAREEKIIDMHSQTSDICFKHSSGESFDIKGISCPPSLYLGTFTNNELNKAIIKYQIPHEALMNHTLRTMAMHPVLLRLFSEYHKKYGNLPNPADPLEFKTIFLGKRGDPPETNILGRLGIIGKKRDYLVQLTTRFLDKGDELKAAEIANLINQENNFKTVRSAGLIKEIWDPAYTAFQLNELYKNHLEHMVELAGITIKKPKIPKPIEPPPLKGSAADRKKYDYYVNLGKNYAKSNQYQEALSNYQQARKASEELYDVTLTIEIEELIKQTENLIKKEHEEKEKGKREVEEKKIKEVEPRGKQEVEEKARKEPQFRNIISFRSAQIPQFEADILQEIEILTKKEFVKVDKIEKTSKMRFSVENQRIIGIGFYDCKLMTLPESINNLSSLKELRLYSNKLMTVPESIGKLSSLQTLDLRNNRLTTLPESIGLLTSLEKLFLYNNELKTLPESIIKLEKLKHLDVSVNQLTKLPESIGNLKKLEHLSLHNNNLSTLPESIWSLTSLQILYLGNNKLSTLPELIDNLKSLTKLYFRDNKLTTLPQSILNLISLQNLYIKNNPLDSKAKFVIKQLKQKGVDVSS